MCLFYKVLLPCLTRRLHLEPGVRSESVCWAGRGEGAEKRRQGQRTERLCGYLKEVCNVSVGESPSYPCGCVMLQPRTVWKVPPRLGNV